PRGKPKRAMPARSSTSAVLTTVGGVSAPTPEMTTRVISLIAEYAPILREMPSLMIAHTRRPEAQTPLLQPPHRLQHTRLQHLSTCKFVVAARFALRASNL